MKKTFTSLSALFLFFISFGQAPGVKWTSYYSTHQSDVFYDVKSTADGGYILAGSDTSFSYSKDQFLNKSTNGLPLLLKKDKDGNTLWKAIPSGVFISKAAFTSVQNVKSGGIIAAGYGYSYPNPVKYFVAKYDDNGNKLWSGQYGGITNTSRALSIKETSDGGYIVAGYSTSNDGDVSGNHNPGTADAWLLKLDGTGNIQWQKCFGGSADDTAYDIIQTSDDGFIVAGVSSSTDGDLSGNNGLSDGWIFKTDNSGNLLWQKNIGGAGDEDFKSIVLNSDTSYTLTGYTTSSSLTSNGSHGKKDLWVAKVKDVTGQIVWSKSFGGSEDEQGFSIQRTIGNRYLIGGYTESADGDITVNNGAADAWLLHLAQDGNLIWQKCIGTIKDDFGMAALYLTEKDFAIAGYAEPLIVRGGDYTDGFLSRLGNANIIKGLVFNDANLNGIKDPLEAGFDEAFVTTAKPNYTRSTFPQKGLFSLDVDTGSYSTSVKVINPYYNVTPANINSSFATYFNTDSITFAAQPIPGKQDLIISVAPLTSARSGFAANYKIYYKNVGTNNISAGQILFIHDSRLNVISSSPSITSTNGDTLKWNYTNLNSLDTASIFLSLQIPLPPALNLGDTISSVGIINPGTGDITPHDDTSFIKQRIIAAYDPNGKAENNAGKISTGYITDGNYLTYIIRFQNTGTDTALNVVITDTLSDKLDWNTLQMIGASHPYNFAIENGNKLTWNFNNINLPDSIINEPASHGYISYRIKPNNNLVAGDSIPNTASIYFDFNIAVPTNNAFTIVENNSTLPLHLLNFSGVYRDGNAVLNWSTVNEFDFEKFEIERSTNGSNYNSVGLQYANGNINVSNYQFKDNLSASGGNIFYYRLKLIDRDGRFTYSQVLLIRRDNRGISGIRVTPNPVIYGQALVMMSSNADNTIRLNVFDNAGRIVLKQRNNIFQGNNSIIINNLNLLGAGVYTIEIINGKDRFSSKFELLK